jgi:molybdenum-dependent DNA-binding transcriptional regulator ModE
MNDLSEEPATQSRKTGRGKGRGKGKGKRIIESDDDFELIEERAKSEDTAQSVDEDVLIYHREVSLALNRAES